MTRRLLRGPARTHGSGARRARRSRRRTVDLRGQRGARRARAGASGRADHRQQGRARVHDPERGRRAAAPGCPAAPAAACCSPARRADGAASNPAGQRVTAEAQRRRAADPAAARPARAAGAPERPGADACPASARSTSTRRSRRSPRRPATWSTSARSTRASPASARAGGRVADRHVVDRRPERARRPDRHRPQPCRATLTIDSRSIDPSDLDPTLIRRPAPTCRPSAPRSSPCSTRCPNIAIPEALARLQVTPGQQVARQQHADPARAVDLARDRGPERLQLRRRRGDRGRRRRRLRRGDRHAGAALHDAAARADRRGAAQGPRAPARRGRPPARRAPGVDPLPRTAASASRGRGWASDGLFRATAKLPPARRARHQPRALPGAHGQGALARAEARAALADHLDHAQGPQGGGARPHLAAARRPDPADHGHAPGVVRPRRGRQALQAAQERALPRDADRAPRRARWRRSASARCVRFREGNPKLFRTFTLPQYVDIG